MSRLVAANEDFEYVAPKYAVALLEHGSAGLPAQGAGGQRRGTGPRHPREAAASGAIAYVSKEHLAADTIRDLWNTRDSGTFTSC